MFRQATSRICLPLDSTILPTLERWRLQLTPSACRQTDSSYMVALTTCNFARVWQTALAALVICLSAAWWLSRSRRIRAEQEAAREKARAADALADATIDAALDVSGARCALWSWITCYSWQWANQDPYSSGQTSQAVSVCEMPADHHERPGWSWSWSIAGACLMMGSL